MYSITAVAISLIVVGVLEIVFWTNFFLVENRNPESSEVYLAFERSFPVPDLLWLTPISFIGSYGLFNDQKYGFYCAVLAGCSLFFISLLDISFNSMNGQYTKKISDGVLNAIVNTLCFGFGIWFMVFGYHYLVG
jgi:TRAP-type C4-dicarboxylate transport system permease small subunit